MKKNNLNKHVFEVGNIVKCIKANAGSFIREGGVYTIDKIIADGFCALKEIDEGHSYSNSRFILYEENTSKEKDIKKDIKQNKKQLEELIKILN